MDALATRSAELGFSDPALLDRGLNNLLGKAYREQANREAVAQRTIEYLADDPPSAASTGPSEDWIDLFESYASRATSENMRDLYARVLAGEIRKPGNFSAVTLHFVSVLDTSVAGRIEKVLPWCVNSQFFPKDAIGEAVGYGEWLVLDEVGFVTFGSGRLTRTETPNENNYIFFRMGLHAAIVLKMPDNSERQIPAVKLTKPGMELAQTLSAEFKIDEVARWAWKLGPEQVLVVDIATDEQGNEVVNTPGRAVSKPEQV